MIKITIDDREVRRTLNQLLKRTSDLTPVMHDIGQALVEGSRGKIQAGTSWAGEAFAENKATTLERKKGSKPLVDSGSLVSFGLHYEADAHSVTVGASPIQSAVMQFGAKKGQFGRSRRGPIPWGDIPPRPYLPITAFDGGLEPEAERLVLDTISAFIEDVF